MGRAHVWIQRSRPPRPSSISTKPTSRSCTDSSSRPRSRSSNEEVDPALAAAEVDHAPDDGFVHHSAINSRGYRDLREGAKVSYETELGEKGPRATYVSAL
jgi:cold shock protein